MLKLWLLLEKGNFTNKFLIVQRFTWQSFSRSVYSKVSDRTVWRKPWTRVYEFAWKRRHL